MELANQQHPCEGLIMTCGCVGESGADIAVETWKLTVNILALSTAGQLTWLQTLKVKPKLLWHLCLCYFFSSWSFFDELDPNGSFSGLDPSGSRGIKILKIYDLTESFDNLGVRICDPIGSLDKPGSLDLWFNRIPDPDPWDRIPRSIFGIHGHVWLCAFVICGWCGIVCVVVMCGSADVFTYAQMWACVRCNWTNNKALSGMIHPAIHWTDSACKNV